MTKPKYIRIPADLFQHEKIIKVGEYLLSKHVLVVWLHLLTKSKMDYKTGLYEYSISPVTLNMQTLSTMLGEDVEVTEYSITVLEKEGLLEMSETCIYLFPFWLDKHDRSSPRYKAWRKSVFERDGYKCVVCGSKLNIEAHHKEPWSKNKDRRYDVDNGVTLCRKCHYRVHGKRERKHG